VELGKARRSIDLETLSFLGIGHCKDKRAIDQSLLR
jgi:hypothetical protein